MTWGYTEATNPDGYGIFYVQAWKGDGTREDITFFRGVPTLITSMHFGDPFGDSLATLEFPQCTGFDSGTGDTWFLNENINIDILWVPASTVSSDYPVIDPRTNKYGTMFLHPEDAIPHWEGFIVSIDPQISGVSVNCQGALYQLDRYYAKPMFPQRPKTVEALFGRLFDPRRRGVYTQDLYIDWNGVYGGYVWERYYEQADYDRFLDMDRVLQRFVPTDLTPGVNTEWTGYVTRLTGSWDKALTGYIQNQLAMLYVDLDKMPALNKELLTEGDKWTITKDAGRLPVMYLKRQKREPDFVVWYGQPGVDAQLTRDGSVAINVVFGRGTGFDSTAWMVQNFPEEAPWSTWAPIGWDKTPNTAFGLSTGVDADNNPIGIYHWDDTGWYEEVPVTGGIVPLREALYDGYDAEWERTNNYWVNERYWSNIPSGFDQEEGEAIAKQYISRDKDPGWTGTITLQVDGRDMADNPISKWSIKDGSVIWLKGFRGSSTTDYTAARGTAVFHVAQAVQNPQEGTVTLTVDTKFRDLLSIDEVMMHTRDSLAPVRMLQVGKQSGLIEDLVMPWNTKQGSGFVPRFASEMERKSSFPYESDAIAQPPDSIFKPKFITGSYSKKTEVINTNKKLKDACLTGQTPYYIPVNVGNRNHSLRWAFVPVMLSQAGTIVRTEFCAYDRNGNIAPVEFHVSVYLMSGSLNGVATVDVDGMPRITDQVAIDAEAARWNDPPSLLGKSSGLFKNAWYTVDPETGLRYINHGSNLNADYHLAASAYNFQMGWGTYEMPAGYSPGSKQQGTTPECTGQLLDGANWQYNFSQESTFTSELNDGDSKVPSSSYSMTVAIYAQNIDENDPEYDWVYFMGRFYRQTQQGV